MAAKRRGPGLVKTHELPLLQRKHVELWHSTDYRCRELFERADIMSEGATRKESEGATYYGTTSVVLPLVSRGGLVPDERATELARALTANPHARLRAVRMACLEAQLRAGAPLGRIRAELSVRRDAVGVRLDVEVEARVLEVRARSTSGAGTRRRR